MDYLLKGDAKSLLGLRSCFVRACKEAGLKMNALSGLMILKKTIDLAKNEGLVTEAKTDA